MKTVAIDGNEIINMMDIHRIFAEELEFPEWYGMNLDALFDCLCDMTEEVEIVIENKTELSENLGVSFEKLCAVLDDACEENGNISVEIE